MNKIIKLTESNNSTKWKVIKFSPKQQYELFEELSQNELQKFVVYDFGFRFFANTPWATAKDADKIFRGKAAPWWWFENEHKKFIGNMLNLRVSDYGQAA